MKQTVSLKVRIEKDPQTGEDRVPPEFMEAARLFAEHRDTCDECGPAFKEKTGAYCRTGAILFQDLASLPCVEIIPD